MLTADKRTGALTATCDKCHVTRGELGTDRTAADRELRGAGWTPMPRKGLGSERWPWHCDACQPPAPRGFGVSTGDMKPAK